MNSKNYIQGYFHNISIKKEEPFHFHVSTTSRWFRVLFFKKTLQYEFIYSSPLLLGTLAPPGLPGNDWGWPEYILSPPDDLSHGIYIAWFIAFDNDDDMFDIPSMQSADDRTSKALLIILNSGDNEKATILYKIPVFTYFAYNHACEGDKCLYRGNNSQVTFLKPGGATGGTPWDSQEFPDIYDTGSPRQTFEHWDAKFIYWLLSNNYAVDFYSDLDIHFNANNFLSEYKLLISAGHDEYWSSSMRDNIENFVVNGGNIAFFGGNTCWWRVSIVNSGTAMHCDKSIHEGDMFSYDQWCRTKPENSITGVSYRNGGGKWSGPRRSIGFLVRDASHWIFYNTDLQNDDEFGKDDYLIGYECDGTDCIMQADFTGKYKVMPTTLDGTSENFLILASAKLDDDWDDFKDKNFLQPSGGMFATMGVFSKEKGRVFTAPTTDWARVLFKGNKEVDQITRNVINNFISD